MKSKIIYALLVVFSLLAFTGCSLSKKVRLKNEKEAASEFADRNFRLDIYSEKIKPVVAIKDLTKIKYGNEVVLGILEDEFEKLVSLKVNGVEKINQIKNNQLKITIKENTKVVASYDKKDHVIKVSKDSAQYVKFISNISLKIGEVCQFKLHNLDELYNYDVNVSGDVNLEKTPNGIYKFTVKGEHEISLVKKANFQPFEINYSMKKSQFGQYNLIDALLSGVLFRPSDMKFSNDGLKLKEAQTEYQKNDLGKLVNWKIALKEVVIKEYKFGFDYLNLFKENLLGSRVELLEYKDKLTFRLYKKDSKTEYEDYKVDFKLSYKDEKGIAKKDTITALDGEYKFSIEGKKEVALEINVELL